MMRTCRLFVFLAAFAGLVTSAQAQYTSKSTGSSGFTTKTAETTSAQPTDEKAPEMPNPYTDQAQAPSNPYTGSGSTAPAAIQPQPDAQPTFRPRPATVETASTEGADDLPSFDAFENPGAVGKQGSAQGSNLPPPPPPKGEVWFYISDFKNSDVNGAFKNCIWKVIVQNRTDTEITDMRVEYNISGNITPLRIKKVKPNSAQIKNHAVYSEKCPAMAQVKPTVKVISCRMGILNGQACAEYIKVK